MKFPTVISFKQNAGLKVYNDHITNKKSQFFDEFGKAFSKLLKKSPMEGQGKILAIERKTSKWRIKITFSRKHKNSF